MRSLLLSLSLLLPSLAAAQTASLTLGFGPNGNLSLVDNVFTAGPGDCNEEVRLNWSVSMNVCGQPLSLWVVDSDTACGTTVPTENALRRTVSVDDVNGAEPSGEANSLHAGTVTFTIADVFNAVPPGAIREVTACGSADPQTRRFRVCGVARPLVTAGICNADNDVQSTPDDLELVYDTEKPAAPAVTVRELDGKLSVIIPNADDIATARVQIREASQSVDAFRDVANRSPVTPFEISPLTNGTAYVVRASQTDLAGNVSDFSAEQQATPMDVTDFYEAYQAAGGTETGGCAAAGAGLSVGAALALLGLWLAASRRKA